MARKGKEATKINLDNFENDNKLNIIMREDGTRDFSDCTKEKFATFSEEEKYHVVDYLIKIIQNLERKYKAECETSAFHEKRYNDEYNANHRCAADFTNYKAQKYRQIDMIKKRLDFLQDYVKDVVDTFIDNEKF